MHIRQNLVKYHQLLSRIGVDPLRFFRSIRGVPAYVRDYLVFRRLHDGKIEFNPCLQDRYEEGGTTKSEYFWQDLIVARWIHDARPEKHVDVGSRVDGFVAHVACFRQIEVLDIRPISTPIPGVVFKQADLMSRESLPKVLGAGVGYCDSLSCLHALEHFGLGRYGDPIDPLGHERGIANLAQLVQLGGTFYLSTPIGQERVEFNANRVFDPRSIVCCAEAAGMTLQKLIVITPANGPQESAVDSVALAELALQRYQLGLFIFSKTNP